jgi:hypothetical protein
VTKNAGPDYASCEQGVVLRVPGDEVKATFMTLKQGRVRCEYHRPANCASGGWKLGLPEQGGAAAGSYGLSSVSFGYGL